MSIYDNIAPPLGWPFKSKDEMREAVTRSMEAEVRARSEPPIIFVPPELHEIIRELLNEDDERCGGER